MLKIQTTPLTLSARCGFGAMWLYTEIYVSPYLPRAFGWLHGERNLLQVIVTISDLERLRAWEMLSCFSSNEQ